MQHDQMSSPQQAALVCLRGDAIAARFVEATSGCIFSKRRSEIPLTQILSGGIVTASSWRKSLRIACCSDSI